MAPEIRIKELEKQVVDRENSKQAGVMALFYPDTIHRARLLLILRKTYRGVHSNQVAFPGGKSEDGDLDLKQTALRETYEEVGVPPEKVEVLRSLSSVYIPPSNFEVHPFMGIYHDPLPFVMQTTEVEALVEVPVIDFMDDRKIVMQNLTTSYATNINVPAFKLNGYTVWGATAMMMSEIKEMLKQVL